MHTDMILQYQILFEYLGLVNETGIDNFAQKEDKLEQLQQMDDILYCITNPSQG